MELHQIITYDGEVYDLSNLKSRFMLIPTPGGWGFPPVEFHTDRSYKQDGVSEFGYTVNQRKIALEHRAVGCSREEYWEARELLINITRPNRRLFYPGPVTYIFGQEDLTKRAIIGRPISPLFAPSDVDRWDEWAFEDSIEIECFDPIWFNPDPHLEEDTSFTTPAEALIFDAYFPDEWYFDSGTLGVLTLAITYIGNWKSLPTIYIDGPCLSWRLEHEELGLNIYYAHEVANGETLTLDLTSQTLVTDIDGSSLWGLLNPDGDQGQFRLEPDVPLVNGLNTLNLYVNGALLETTAFRVEWYERYFGI